MLTKEGNPIPAGASIVRATSNGDADAVRALLAEGADVDQMDRGGHTALMVAAIFDHVEIAHLLLAAGADVRLQDNLGLTAKEWADRRGSWEVAQLISNSSPAEILTSHENASQKRATTQAHETIQAQEDKFLSEPAAVATGSSPGATRRQVDAATSLSERDAVATESSTGATPRQEEPGRHALEAESETAQQPDTVRWKKFHQQIMAAQERGKTEESRREADRTFLSERGAVANQSSTETRLGANDVAHFLSEPGAGPTWSATSATQREMEESRNKTPIATQHDALSTEVAEQESVPSWSATAPTQDEMEESPTETPQDAPGAVVAQIIPSPRQESRPTAAQLARIAATIEHLRMLEESNREDEGSVRAGVQAATPVHGEFPNEPVQRPQPSVSAPSDPLGIQVDHDARDTTLEHIPLQLFSSRAIHEPQPIESDSPTPLKRCPQCNTTYRNELLMYCVNDATKLIGDDDSLFISPEINDRSRQTLWALVAITAVFGALLGYLINNYRSRERVPNASVASQIEQPQPEKTGKQPPLVIGALSGTEVAVPEPEYPARAKAEGVSGIVTVRIQVNQRGRVVLARSSSGDSRLRAAAVAAAQKATFSPEKLAGLGRVVSGSITYNFVPQTEAPTATGSQVATQTGSPSSNEASPATGSSVANVGGISPQVGGPLVGAETNLPRPDYPAHAKSRGISGTITVVVRVNREGRVISWRSLGGDPQLRAAALKAAKNATFSPEKLPGQGEVVGTITYNFKPNS